MEIKVRQIYEKSVGPKMDLIQEYRPYEDEDKRRLSHIDAAYTYLLDKNARRAVPPLRPIELVLLSMAVGIAIGGLTTYFILMS